MRRAEHRKLGLTIDYDRFSFRSSASRENSEGVSLNTQSFEISEKFWASIRNLFCLLFDLFDVYLPRGVACVLQITSSSA